MQQAVENEISSMVRIPNPTTHQSNAEEQWNKIPQFQILNKQDQIREQ